MDIYSFLKRPVVRLFRWLLQLRIVWPVFATIGSFSPFFLGMELPFAVPTVGDTGPGPAVLLLTGNGLLLVGGVWVFTLSILLLADRANRMIWGTLATFSYAILFIPVFFDSLTLATNSSVGSLVQLLSLFSAAASVLGGIGGLGAMLSIDNETSGKGQSVRVP